MHLDKNDHQHKHEEIIHILTLLAGLFIFFKLVPLLFGLHAYYTWEADDASLTLYDGTELYGKVSFGNVTRTMYSIDIGDNVVAVPKSSVQKMTFPVKIDQ